MRKATKAAKLLGKLGGESTSASKTEASRVNGTKGGRPRKRVKELSDSMPSVLGPTLELINQLEREEIIEKPTIGGPIALMYYTQPMYTDDLDMFCVIPNQGLIVHLGPISSRLEELGCAVNNMYVHIQGVDVQSAKDRRMKNNGDVSREDIYKAKAESRRQRAADSFDNKLVSLVRMQMINYEMAEAAGRPARKPWHFGDREKIAKISGHTRHTPQA